MSLLAESVKKKKKQSSKATTLQILKDESREVYVGSCPDQFTSTEMMTAAHNIREAITNIISARLRAVKK